MHTPQVILLAAGQSTRVKPLSEKIFFKFLGKTVLQHQIETIQNSGLTDVFIIGNPQNIEEIKTLCGKIEGNFSFGIQKNPDGIHHGILAAKEAGIDEEKPILIVCSNDMVENSALKNTVTAAENSDSEIFLCGKVMENYFPGGYLKLKSGKLLEGIVEKPKLGTEPSNLVTIMVHLYKNPKILFENLKKYQEEKEYEEVIQILLDKGNIGEAVEYDGYWQAIKYPWHFLDLTDFFLSKISSEQGSIPPCFQKRIHSSAQISKNTVIKGDVIIEEGVKIFDFAVINGPAYIGKNTIIANHALIRNSHIGENCVVGHGTEVARSYLRDNCWTHQNFVGDSVFDNNVSLGAGTRTGNLRLDEEEIFSTIKGEKVGTGKNKLGCIIGKNCRLGINVSTMPGIKIGSGSFLGAGGVYNQDILDNTFNTNKTSLKSQKNRKLAEEREKFST